MMAGYLVELETKHKLHTETINADMAINEFWDKFNFMFLADNAEEYKIIVHRYDEINKTWRHELTEKRRPRDEAIEKFTNEAITFLSERKVNYE